MGYAQETAPGKLLTSMLGETDRLGASLSEIHGRLVKIADTLFGPELREVTRDAGNAPAAVRTVSQNVDSAHGLADRIHNELTRIEARL